MSRSRLLIMSALLQAFLLFLTCCHARNKKISRGYKIRALVQKPGNFTLAGEVGARCLFNFNEWNPPYETEQDITCNKQQKIFMSSPARAEAAQQPEETTTFMVAKVVFLRPRGHGVPSARDHRPSRLWN